MLIFYRPAFKSGVMYVKDRNEEGLEFKIQIRPSNQGKEIAIKDEKFVKGLYPRFFYSADEFQDKKRELLKAKQEGKVRKH